MPINSQIRPKQAATLEEQLQTDFVTLSSHQLRTPLSAVKWFTEIMLTQRAGKLNKKQQDYLQEIYHSNERAIALVNDLLQVSRVQQDKLHLDLTKVNVGKLVEEVMDAHRTALKSKDISVRSEIINGPLPEMLVDKAKIKRVVQNLLNNSINYSPQKGNIEVMVKKDGRNILCSIRDWGVGIPADEQSKLFSCFYRGSNVTKIQPDGTGLGLYIAKSLVAAHKGKMWFESQEGKGTTFYFTLPIKDGKE